MSEVVTFEAPRRRGRAQSGGGASNRALTEFFDKHELNQILQVYSRKVMSGDWLDYAVSADEQGVVFAIYGRVANVPLYRIRKRPAGRREDRYEVSSRGRVLKTGKRLDGVLKILNKRKPKLVHPD